MATIYGLPSCDSCRKAVKALKTAGYSVKLVDLRAEPVGEDTLMAWWEALGPGLLNTRSTTWRNLSEAERAGAPLELLAAHPTLIKRPVIAHEGALSLGWSKAVQAEFGL